MKTRFVYKLPELENNMDYIIKVESAGESENYVIHTYSLDTTEDTTTIEKYDDFDDYFKAMYDDAIEDLYGENGTATDKYDIVYVTKTGYKYHKKNCKSLNSSSTPMFMYEANLAKYLPCKICN